MHVCMRLCVYVCMYVCLYVQYVCVCVCRLYHSSLRPVRYHLDVISANTKRLLYLQYCS